VQEWRLGTGYHGAKIRSMKATAALATFAVVDVGKIRRKRSNGPRGGGAVGAIADMEETRKRTVADYGRRPSPLPPSRGAGTAGERGVLLSISRCELS
jgi:hypothetical protein